MFTCMKHLEYSTITASVYTEADYKKYNRTANQSISEVQSSHQTSFLNQAKKNGIQRIDLISFSAKDFPGSSPYYFY